MLSPEQIQAIVILALAVASFILAYILVALIGGHVLFSRVFRRPFPQMTYDRSPQHICQDTIFGMSENWFYSHRMEFEDLKLTTYDGTNLHAYYRPAKEEDNRHVVFLLHGWKDKPSSMAAFARMYLDRMDCHLVIVFMRGHGLSGGRHVGFGLSDSEDLLMWTDKIKKMLDGQLKVVYHGCSMGAATALFAAASKRFPKDLRCVVADGAYSDFRHVLIAYLRRRYKVAFSGVIFVASLLVKRYMGYSIKAMSISRVAHRITCPVLLIHGAADEQIPFEMSRYLFKLLTCPKRLLVVEMARHMDAYQIAPGSYHCEIERLLSAADMFEPDESPDESLDESSYTTSYTINLPSEEN